MEKVTENDIVLHKMKRMILVRLEDEIEEEFYE
jgi:hypothetical protein